MKTMREININGRILQYRLMLDCSEHDSWDWTEFYEGTETVKKRVRSSIFDIFGTIEYVEVPKLVFKIWDSCESTRITKDEWRKKISRELDLLDRKAELERGELI